MRTSFKSCCCCRCYLTARNVLLLVWFIATTAHPTSLLVRTSSSINLQNGHPPATPTSFGLFVQAWTPMFPTLRSRSTSTSATTSIFGKAPLSRFGQTATVEKINRMHHLFHFHNKRNHPPVLHSSSLDDDDDDDDESTPSLLQRTLSTLTSAFPLFVLGSAFLGLKQPQTLLWTNRGTLISWMLAAVMCATGLTLEKKDFTKVLETPKNRAAVPAGVLCQFLIMPLTACIIGRNFLLHSVQGGGDPSTGASLFLGLALVGCSPGGTASNLVSLIAKADVALSVLLTSCSTILASVVTPILVQLLVGSAVQVSGWTLCVATAKVVLGPVLFGMLVNSKAPNLSQKVSQFTPFLSVVLVSLICGGVVAQNSSLMQTFSSSLLPRVVSSVLALHCIGFGVGYAVPKLGLGFSERTSRTISIETGMQNSALAVVLARSMGAPPIASLPGALSATAHSCLGSLLAGYWYSKDQGQGATKSES